MNWTFVETHLFTSRWRRRMGDDSLRRLQLELSADPERGSSIPGCGILRKMRFADVSRSKGKRGGVRVIYVATPEVRRIDLISVYGKDEADDLSPKEVKELCGLARMLRVQAIEAFQPPWRHREGAK